MKFIGHLDTQRYFQKLLRRADIPVAYTEGFSPHQKLSFAQPLGVGVESRGEYFDIELKSDDCLDGLSSDSVIERLNYTQASGIFVTDCVKLKDDAKNAMASVFAADYMLTKSPGHTEPFSMMEAIESFKEAESWVLIKETKKSRRSLELKDLVYELSIKEDEIYVRLNASSNSSVKPLLLIGDLYEKRGYQLPPFSYRITRLDIFDEDFRPLIEAGERF